MESLSDTTWDVLISGTGLPQSLLALALSRSGKKILHVDRNGYYGGAEAALSLQEAEDWVKGVNGRGESDSLTFSDASISSSPDAATQLSFSRAYSLCLSPQLIYTQSALIPILVSSRVYKQLEFQAMGSWWICRSLDIEDDDDDTVDTTTAAAAATAASVGSEEGTSELPPKKKRRKAAIQRVPNGREDLVPDETIDFRSKMNLVKFLNSVAKPDEMPPLDDADAEAPLSDYLAKHFKLSGPLHAAIHGISLSSGAMAETKTKNALPRIRRHLRSIGVFGPGFGSVIPKWGGASEIAQVACRAGAVGGAVYVLDRGVRKISVVEENADLNEVELSDGEKVKARWVVGSTEDLPPRFGTMQESQEPMPVSSRSISVVSSALKNLYTPPAEGGPSPAGAVVVVPGDPALLPSPSEDNSDIDVKDVPPTYLFIHSADTGECPTGQSIIYASTSLPPSNHGHTLLNQAITTLLEAESAEDQKGPPSRVLWSMRYTQHGPALTPTPPSPDAIPTTSSSSGPEKEKEKKEKENRVRLCQPPSLDLAFDDTMLENVRAIWRDIVMTLDRDRDRDRGRETDVRDEDELFMVFEDREVSGGVGPEE